MKSRLRKFLRSPLRPPAVHVAESAASCAPYLLAATKTLFWPGATPHFEGRSRPTLQRKCMVARSISSCRSCRRLCEGPDEESFVTARTRRHQTVLENYAN